MNLFKKAKKGFTLVELVVVIAVIAILSAVSVGAYFGITDSANSSRLEQEAKQIHTAIQAVALAPNDHSSMSKTGLTITHAGKFEAAIEENLGIDVALTDVQDTKDPTKPTIYFTHAAYSGKLGDKVYASFEYYSNEIGGKKAVADVVTGDCKATNTSTIIEDSLGDHDRINNSVTVNIEEYATAHSWENSKQYSTILADENITISVVGGADSGKYYTSGTNWRIYQKESPRLTIEGDYSITINSISVTYNVENRGVLTYNEVNIASNDVVEIGSNNAVFGVGNTGSDTNGQVRVTSITVDYIKNTTTEEPAPEILPVIESISEALVAEEGREVRLQGTVSSITSEWNGSNMNFVLTDDEDNSISVYALETEVELGDILNVSGTIGYYMGSNQVQDATAEITGHDDSYDAVVTSISEAITKPDGTNVELTGEVVEIHTPYSDKYDNISVYISDEEGNRILAFRLKGNVKIHDIITVKGTMDTYQETATRQVGAGAEFEDTGSKGDHVYSEATCFEASTCTLCGAVNGDRLEHTDTLDNDGYCDLCHWDLNATTVSKTIAELITSEEWTSSTTKQSFKLDDIVSVKVDGGDYSGNAYTDHIRIYATDTPAGSLTISVPDGVTLTSVKISTKTDSSDYAFLCVGEDTNDISNVTTNISGTSVNLNSIKNGTNGKQVRVTAIEVSYRIIDTSKGYLTKITANPESLNFTSDVAQNISILAQYSVEKDIDVDETLVTWKSNDENVATVNDQGLVTPVANGNASIIATYLGASVEIPVTVSFPTQGGEEGGNEQDPDLNGWYLVTDASTLKVGDILCIASNEKGKVATTLSSDYLQAADSVFSDENETITTFPKSGLILTLGGEKDAWTLETETNNLIGSTAAKKLAYDNGTTTWKISIEDGKATIGNTNDSCGRILYNSGSPRFTTYTSAISDSMVLPQLYRHYGVFEDESGSGSESEGANTLKATYTVTSTSEVSSEGGPTGSEATYSSTYGTKCQLTGGNSMTLTLSGYDGCTITGITLSMKSNKSGGKGSLSLNVGSEEIYSISDKTFNNEEWNGAYTQSYVDVTKDVTATTVGTGEKIVITISASANSLYCQSFTISYTTK